MAAHQESEKQIDQADHTSDIQPDLSGLIPAPRNPVRRNLFIVSLVLGNCALIATVLFLRQQGILPEMALPSPVAVVSSPSPSPQSSPNTERPGEREDGSRFVLVKKDETGSVGIEAFPAHQTNMLVVHNNKLYYPGIGLNTQKVMIYDFATGKISELFDLKKFPPSSPRPTNDDREPQSIDRSGMGFSHMSVYQDTLFFSYGEYMSLSPTFWIDLKNPTAAYLLSEGDIGHVEKWGNHYWLKQMEGDSCAGWGTFSLVDITTKGVTKIAEVKSGCMEGYSSIGLDEKRDQLILGEHSWRELPPEEVTPENDIWGAEDEFHSVDVISLQPPYTRKTIIGSDSMPKRISEVIYQPATDALYLKGKGEQFRFNLETSELKSVEAAGFPTPPPYVQKTLRQRLEKLPLPEGYVWSILE